MRVLALVILVALMGCQSERYYRGVPERKWHELTSEQKEILIDKSLHQELDGGASE